MQLRREAIGGPYIFFVVVVGSQVEQGHGAVGGTVCRRNPLRGRAGLWHGGQPQTDSHRRVTQSGGEVLLHLLPLSLLDVVLGGVLQVGLHLRKERKKMLF